MTMNRWTLALGLVVAAALPAEVSAAPGKTNWWTDYAAAKAEARRTGKPIFLVFRCMP